MAASAVVRRVDWQNQGLGAIELATKVFGFTYSVLPWFSFVFLNQIAIHV
jgi:hypothetical protein